MSKKNLFARIQEWVDRYSSPEVRLHSNKDIVCETEQIKEYVKKFMKENCWSFRRFANFLELIGLKTPVTLSDFDKRTRTFKCVTALNEEFRIWLSFREYAPPSEIHVKKGGETRFYIINSGFSNKIPRIYQRKFGIEPDYPDEM